MLQIAAVSGFRDLLFITIAEKVYVYKNPQPKINRLVWNENTVMYNLRLLSRVIRSLMLDFMLVAVSGCLE